MSKSDVCPFGERNGEVVGATIYSLLIVTCGIVSTVSSELPVLKREAPDLDLYMKFPYFKYWQGIPIFKKHYSRLQKDLLIGKIKL